MKKICSILIMLVVAACAVRGNVDKAFLRERLKVHTLIAVRDGEIRYYDERGLAPLLVRVENGAFKDAFVADRVVGKASALLHVYGGAREVYTPVLSKAALPVYEKYNIPFSSDQVVEYIHNRDKTGIDPWEKAVENTDDPAEAFRILNAAAR